MEKCKYRIVANSGAAVVLNSEAALSHLQKTVHASQEDLEKTGRWLRHSSEGDTFNGKDFIVYAEHMRTAAELAPVMPKSYHS